MIDREKVLKGLECLSNENNICSKNTCPYYMFESCVPEIIHDTLELLKELKEQPEQKHGHWKDDKYGNMLCSVCGGLAIQAMTGCLVDRHLAPYLSDYCPNCGAKMDEEVQQDG